MINCGSSQFPVHDYADRYSVFMTNYMSTQGASISNFVSSIVATLLPQSTLVTSHRDSNGVVTSIESTLSDKLAAITAALPLPSFTVDGNALLTWPANPDPAQTIAIQKRDAASQTAAVCNLSLPSSDSGSNSASKARSTPSVQSNPSAPPTTTSQALATTPVVTPAPVSMSYGIIYAGGCVQEIATTIGTDAQSYCGSVSITFSSLTSWPVTSSASLPGSSFGFFPCVSISITGTSTSCVFNTASINSVESAIFSDLAQI